MKQIALMLTLLLPTAAACPIKAGYFANGQYQDTTGLTPLCTAQFKKIAKDVKPGEYGELYRTDLTAAGGFKV
jgi:hypothetical protein